MSVIKYSQQGYPFCRVVGDMLNCYNLMLLHEKQKEQYAVCLPGKDQSTEFHNTFYSKCKDSEFLGLYYRFISYIYQHIFNDDNFLFQKIPTFRVQLPNNKAVGGVSHRDRDYNHSPKEINVLVALTPMIGSSSLFVESQDGLRDFSLVTLNPGECLVFDGANLEHGNLINTTGWTRVSFDFRLIHRRDYSPDDRVSVAHGVRFIEGEYYESYRKD